MLGVVIFLLLRVWECQRASASSLIKARFGQNSWISRPSASPGLLPEDTTEEELPPYTHNPVRFYSPGACCCSVVGPAATSITGCGEAATALARSLSLKAREGCSESVPYDFSKNGNTDGITDLLNMGYHGFDRCSTIILFSAGRGTLNWGGAFPRDGKCVGPHLRNFTNPPGPSS